jgi:hypothetical protein
MRTLGRAKRDIWALNETQASEHIGIVYTTQLSSQLTALSLSVQKATLKIFNNAFRDICSSLQSIVDAMFTLAAANPTLLARSLLNTTFIKAKLVNSGTLEISPCAPISYEYVHFSLMERCFSLLPVTFIFHGHLHHGFLDPINFELVNNAHEVPCDTNRFIYIPLPDGTFQQFDQEKGEINLIPPEEQHTLKRFGTIDFPEQMFTSVIFKNHVLANLSEVYSYEQVHQNLKGTDFLNYVNTLSKSHQTGWRSKDDNVFKVADALVSTGFFSFLYGGNFSFWQLWTFCCCLYVTLQICIKLFLPINILQAMDNVNVFAGKQWIADRWENRKRKVPDIEQFSVKTVSPTNRLMIKKSIFEGLANNTPTKFLLDTGAMVTVCFPDAQKRLNITTLKPPRFPGIVGIDNKMVACRGQSDIVVEIQGRRVNVTVHVVSSIYKKCCFLHELPFWSSCILTYSSVE